MDTPLAPVIAQHPPPRGSLPPIQTLSSLGLGTHLDLLWRPSQTLLEGQPGAQPSLCDRHPAQHLPPTLAVCLGISDFTCSPGPSLPLGPTCHVDPSTTKHSRITHPAPVTQDPSLLGSGAKPESSLQPPLAHLPHSSGPGDFFCCCLVSQSCLTLCDPTNCSTPVFPALHHLPELAQTHVHQVGEAIQPSHPLSSPSPPALNLSQHQGLFQ